MASSSLTRKAGPLPVWAWAIIGLAGAYLLYRHFSGSPAAGTITGATPSASTPIPSSDQSGGGVGSASGTSGTTTPTTQTGLPDLTLQHQGLGGGPSTGVTGVGLQGQGTNPGSLPKGGNVNTVPFPGPVPVR